MYLVNRNQSTVTEREKRVCHQVEEVTVAIAVIAVIAVIAAIAAIAVTVVTVVTATHLDHHQGLHLLTAQEVIRAVTIPAVVIQVV